MNRIIVVDDDEEVLDTIQLVLELGGYYVEPLSDAARLATTISETNPDLIILDVVLGKLDGRAINDELKSNAKTKHIPVLMMSGLYNAKDVNSSNTPPDDFLPKPFKMDVFLEKVTYLINKKKERNYIN
jgi:DNA-binding response OmpR family regulator